jgi:hypothetical protein
MATMVYITIVRPFRKMPVPKKGAAPIGRLLSETRFAKGVAQGLPERLPLLLYRLLEAA